MRSHDVLTITDQILQKHQGVPGALLPVLHGIQDAIGYIPNETVPHIADGLNLSRADVHGVISFYHDFRTTPPGQHVIRLCRAEACQAMGSRKLEEHVKSSLKINYHETSLDGMFSLEAVYCLGNCACTPSMLIDDQIHARVTPDTFDEIISEYRSAAGDKA